MGLFNTGSQFPYTNFHDLNLDWILKKMKELIVDWAKMRSDWDNYQLTMNSAWATYKEGLNNEWSDYKTATDADLAAYKRNLTAEWTAYQVENNAAFQAFKSGIEARQDDFENQFRELKQFVIDYFDNVDWEKMLNDLMDRWYSDGTLIRLIAPYLPFVTPEMYGAVGDGVADDSGALNKLMAAGVNNHRAVWFSPNTTFRIASQVEIPGTIDIHGNGATIKADAGVNGLVFTQHGPESTIDNLTINSNSAQWPDLGIADLTDASMDPEHGATWQDTCTKGLIVSALHSKISRVNINNFGIGLYYDERIYDATQNQTGVIIDNIHVRYCGVGCRIGYKLRNGKTTDYTITNCTFAGRHIGLMITDAIGYFVSNVHTWGLQDEGNRPLCGIYTLNTSITTYDRVYIEPCELYAMYIHTRKGLNIDNFVYVSTFDYRADQARVFYFDGSSGYKVNLDNIELRPGTPDYNDNKPYVKPILIHQGNRGIFNIGNVFTSELLQHDILNPSTGEMVTIKYGSVLPGIAFDVTDQTYGYFYMNNAILQIKSNPYLMQINGKFIQAEPKEIFIPYAETAGTGSLTLDLSMFEKSRPFIIEVSTTTRDVDDNMTVGRYTIGCLVKAGQSSSDPQRGVVVVNDQAVLTDSKLNINLDTSVKNQLTISATQTEAQLSSELIVEVKNMYFAVSQTPETNPYN